jgi:hypothetical protein
MEKSPLERYWENQSFQIQGRALPVWPPQQEVLFFSEEPQMMVAYFDDVEPVNHALRARLLELEQDPAFTHRMRIGGSKIRDVDRWALPEADLINARARAFYSLAANVDAPTVELSWANVSRNGDYLSPHSHDHCTGSVVYFVDPGDTDPDNSLSGRLSFVDPRIEGCCDREPHCATREVSPEIRAGALVLFPSQLVHFVHTYSGTRPRISIAWNLS